MKALDFNNISRFTSEALESLKSLSDLAIRHYPKSAKEMLETMRLLRIAEKFSLPDDGVLVDLKSYRNEYSPLLRLPYPCITLEFRTSPLTDSTRIASSKHILCSWSDEAPTSFKISTAKPGTIYYTHCWLDDEQGEWEPSPIIWGFHPEDLVQAPDTGIELDGFHYFPCHPEAFDRAMAKGGEDFIQDDLEQTFRALLEFCLTINCSNITSYKVSAPEKLNNKRLKSNKEPLYSYHVLDIPGGYSNISGAQDSDRNSPRIHWRRGHIRRLSDGKITWVRHTIVGNPEHGIVSKSYNVSAPK